jgi:hypothetical protein
MGDALHPHAPRRAGTAGARRIVPASDLALLVVFGDAITEGIRRLTWRIANVYEGVQR